MIVYLVLIILSVFFTWLRQIGVLKYGMKFSFFLVFLFLALRHDFGNDYSGYFNNYLGVQTLQDEDFYFKGNEVGWLFLNYFFKLIFGNMGFHVMLATMAMLMCIALYRFTTKYIPSQYYTFAIASYLLEPNNILVLSSAMRQSVAVSIFLFCFDFLVERRYVHYIVGVLIASLFHTSVLVLFLLITLNLINWKLNLLYVFLMLTGATILLSSSTIIFNQIDFLLDSQESVYSGYTGEGVDQRKLGLGFALTMFLYFAVLVINRNIQYDLKKNTTVKIVVVVLLFTMLGLSIPMTLRLNFYLFPMIVSSYVITLVNSRKYELLTSPIFYKLAPLIIIAFFAYQNYLFWHSEVYSSYFNEYKTVLQSPLW